MKYEVETGHEQPMEGRDPKTNSDYWLHTPLFEDEVEKALTQEILKITHRNSQPSK